VWALKAGCDVPHQGCKQRATAAGHTAAPALRQAPRLVICSIDQINDLIPHVVLSVDA
jgi:hypothetical protein